jgi:hypothetical protein
MMPMERPFGRATVLGLWALPVWALSLLVGTFTHQPPPQTDLAGWSRYVTTSEFLYSHLFASILGGAIGVLGMIALAVVLANRGSVRLTLWALPIGVVANTLLTALFGIAAWAQPAIGRLYLAGQHAQANALYYDAAQPASLVAVGLVGVVLLAASVVLFGVAVAQSGWLPRWAGVGFAISGPLFAIVGFALDNFIQTVADALMMACTAWIAVVVWREAHAAPREAVRRVT